MKRWIALLLTLIMVLSAACALAACPCEGGIDWFTGLGDSDKGVYMTGDDTISYQFAFGHGTNIRHCFHGYTLTVQGAISCCIVGSGDVTWLYDCTGTGGMTNTTSTTRNPLFIVAEGAQLNIDGGTYTALGSNSGAKLFVNNGTVTVYDGVLQGNPLMTGAGAINVGEGSVLVTRTDSLMVVARRPVIVSPTEEQRLTAMEGTAVTLRVEAEDRRPLTYQWYRGDEAIAGATGATYTFTAAVGDNASRYHCVVTNNVGLEAASADYVLTVTAAPAVPTTGDSASLTLWAGMLLLTGAAFICLRRKGER